MLRTLFSAPSPGKGDVPFSPYTGELDQWIIIAVILIAVFVAFITIKGIRRK